MKTTDFKNNKPNRSCVRRTIRFPRQTISDTDTDAIHGETQKIPRHQTTPEGYTYEYTDKHTPSGATKPPYPARGPRQRLATHQLGIARLEYLRRGAPRVRRQDVRWQS